MDSGKKVIIGMVAATVALLFGGVFLVSGGQKSPEQVKTELSTEGVRKTGAENPRVVLVGFSDFSCPACRLYGEVVKQLLNEHPGDLQYAWRHFPLTQYPNSRPAAYAAEAAGIQGKFWEMHEKLYTSQDSWKGAENAEEVFAGYAQEMGLDIDKYRSDVKSEEVVQTVQRDLELGNQLQIQGTPTYFLDGVQMNLSGDAREFVSLVEKAIAAAPENGGQGYLAQARLKVILEGKELDFSDKLKSSENIFFESPDTIAARNKSVTLGELFDSLKIKFTPECLELETGEKYCNSLQKSLKMYINGEVRGEYEKYVPADKDIILITYGEETVAEIQKQIESMVDQSVD